MSDTSTIFEQHYRNYCSQLATERALEKRFSGRFDELRQACEAMGGVPGNMAMPYDLSMVFTALPRLSFLLLFNDADEEFPAKGTVLFQRQGEHYLDPESLAMISAFLVKQLGAARESAE